MAADRRNGPSRRDPPLSGLEVWLNGTPTELDAVVEALTAAGHVAFSGIRRPMTGTDAGRHRQYLRLTITSARRTTRQPAVEPTRAGTLLDLDAARATRRPA